MLVDAEHPRIVGKQGLHGRQPPLAEIAEVRVVRAALGVVVVGNDHARALEAERAEEIHAVEPVHGQPDLVDLVHGHAEAADGEGRRAGEDHGAPVGELGGERLGNGRAAPDRQRVRRAARPGEGAVGHPDGDEPQQDHCVPGDGAPSQCGDPAHVVPRFRIRSMRPARPAHISG